MWEGRWRRKHCSERYQILYDQGSNEVSEKSGVTVGFVKRGDHKVIGRIGGNTEVSISLYVLDILMPETQSIEPTCPDTLKFESIP